MAAVLVTHNSSTFVAETLASIKEQSRKADLLIAVDDFSQDGTRQILEESGFAVVASTSSSQDASTRIAQNFVQALRTAVTGGADVVVLGDHDDVWHVDRVQHQLSVLESDISAAMVASDGFLINEHGAAIPGTIRQIFPVPEDFESWPQRRRWLFALRHSLATGGASAVRPVSVRDWSVPAGWLHDRWWSLQALRSGSLLLDRTPVIDYRVSDAQQVGLDPGDQQRSTARWLARKAQGTGRSASRTLDLIRSSWR